MLPVAPFQTVVCLPVIIHCIVNMLSTMSRSIEKMLKTYYTCSTLPSDCRKWQKLTCKESEGGPDPQGSVEPQHNWRSHNFPMSNAYSFLLAKALIMILGTVLGLLQKRVIQIVTFSDYNAHTVQTLYF